VKKPTLAVVTLIGCIGLLLGSASAFNKAELQKLKKTKKCPECHLSGAMKDNKDVGFDLNKYTHERYITQACLTKDFGWDQRKVPDNDISEYYSLRRRLRKRMAQAIVREHIIGSINQALKGPFLNLGVQVVIKGLSTQTQIEQQFQRLRAGDVEFVDIFNKTQS
jgi:hypothetical protein